MAPSVPRGASARLVAPRALARRRARCGGVTDRRPRGGCPAPGVHPLTQAVSFLSSHARLVPPAECGTWVPRRPCLLAPKRGAATCLRFTQHCCARSLPRWALSVRDDAGQQLLYERGCGCGLAGSRCRLWGSRWSLGARPHPRCRSSSADTAAFGRTHAPSRDPAAALGLGRCLSDSIRLPDVCIFSSAPLCAQRANKRSSRGARGEPSTAHCRRWRGDMTETHGAGIQRHLPGGVPSLQRPRGGPTGRASDMQGRCPPRPTPRSGVHVARVRASDRRLLLFVRLGKPRATRHAACRWDTPQPTRAAGKVGTQPPGRLPGWRPHQHANADRRRHWPAKAGRPRHWLANPRPGAPPATQRRAAPPADQPTPPHRRRAVRLGADHSLAAVDGARRRPARWPRAPRRASCRGRGARSRTAVAGARCRRSRPAGVRRRHPQTGAAIRGASATGGTARAGAARERVAARRAVPTQRATDAPRAVARGGWPSPRAAVPVVPPPLRSKGRQQPASCLGNILAAACGRPTDGAAAVSRNRAALTSLKRVGAQCRFCLPRVVEQPCGTPTHFCGWTHKSPHKSALEANYGASPKNDRI